MPALFSWHIQLHGRLKYFVVPFVTCLYFQVLIAQPTITGFSPQSGSIGSSVIINGTNFSNIASNNIVFFGAVRATVTSSTSTTVTVMVPDGASYQPISVTTNNLTAYSLLPFIVTFTGGGSALAPSSMAAKTDLTADSLTSAVFISDIDGDGKADLLAVNGVANTLSLFKNNSSTGNLSFSPKQDITTGNFPLSVVAGDLDGDGKPDIVVANNSSNSISIYKNNSSPGSFSFSPKIDLSTGSLPDGVAIMDLNGDGRPELIVSNNNSATVSVFKNTSTGGTISFAAKQDFAVGDHPQNVAAADLDGDGKPELVTANGNSNTVSILQNESSSGSISFAANIDFPAGNFPSMVSVGDMDGDGKPDLVLSNYGSPGISVIRNLSTVGAISFSSGAVPLTSASSSSGAAIVDVDGDGLPDIISANHSGFGSANNISVFRNTGSPGSVSFQPNVNYIVGMNPWFIAATDLDGDGMPDIATANSASHSISVLRNTVSPLAIFSFTPATSKKNGIVTITGKGFIGVDSVSFGGVAADSFVVISTGSIIAYVGAGATGNVSVVAGAEKASLGGFTFVPAPTITSFTPNTGGPGATITITGTNFTGTDSISFGTSPAASYIVQSPTTITAIIGVGATGNITIVTPGGKTSVTGFSFSTIPTITSFSPDTTGIGSTVTILGTNFLGATGVSFGGVAAASYTVVSYDTIRAIVGTGANGNILVSTAAGTATAPGFIFNSTPVIKTFNPTTGGNGSQVTITGNYFLGTTAVSFGGIPARSFTVLSKDTLTAVVGNGAGGNISITTQYGTGQSGGFLFTNQPATSYFTPTSGGKGTPVTIYGINLNSTTSVKIGGTAIPFTIISPSELTATITLDSTGTLPVTINTSFGTTTITGFYFQPINILTFSPLSGPVGTTVTITGNHFSTVPSHNQVFFGGVKATVTGTVANGISVMVPAGVTYKPISVTNLDNHLSAYAAKPFITTFNGDADFNANSFSPAGSLSGGNYPSSLFLTDLDGDGKSDLIVGNINGGSFSVFKNISTSGTIAFATKSDFATGQSPNGVVAADLDGDGKPDIVVANFSDNTISIFKNLTNGGTISFAPAISYTLTRSPAKVIVGDLNGDGKPDIAVAIFGSPAVAVFGNTGTVGNISFAPALYFNAGGSSSNIVMGDLDGDGKPDLALSTYADANLSILRNNSNPDTIQFAATKIFPTPSSPTSIAIGDLDGDGIPDLATSGDLASKLTAYRNLSASGSISLAPGLDYQTDIYANDVAIGDLNGDGLPDLVSADNQSGAVSVFKNESQSGNISFSGKSDFNAGVGPQYVVIGDLDGDGKPDMAVSNYLANTITLLRNTENDSLSPRVYSFTPDSGTTGTTVTISGIHFTGATSVHFGGVPATSFEVVSDTSITAVVDIGASGAVTVTVQNKTSGMGGFQFISITADSPFKLIQFVGSFVNLKNQLHWQTANEKSIAKYIIEYSTDSLQFSAIDSVNNSGTGSYTFTDSRKPDSVNYYRLRIIDTSGMISTSNVVIIHVPGPAPTSDKLALNPNPAKGVVLVKLPLSASASTLTLTDMTGQQVKSISLGPNISQTTLDLTNLFPGKYIMVWRSGSQVYKQNILVE